MSKNRKKIVEALQGISAPVEDTVMSGYVKDVDETKATMSVILNTGGQLIEGVMLHALSGSLKGIVVIPEADSDVVICSVDGSGEYMLLQADKVKKVLLDIGSMQAKVSDKIEINCDDIVFNGGDNKGLVKIEKLKSNLDALKSYIKNKLEPKINSGFGSVGNGVATSTLAIAAFAPILSEQINFEDMENPKISH